MRWTESTGSGEIENEADNRAERLDAAFERVFLKVS